MQTTQASCRILPGVCKPIIGFCSDLAANERRDILPESPNGSVLVTSRSREAAFELVGEDENILEVEPMSEGYALALFRKKLEGEDNEDEDEVLELLRNLDYMPLAISQAAAYIRQRAPRVTVSKYLKDFHRSEKDRASLLNNAVRDRRRDGRASNSVLATWQISFEYIQADRSSAARLLSLMSFFDRQGIPEELIMSQYKEDDSTVDFKGDIEVLRSFSLVTPGIENDVFEMHRLVQFAMRKWLGQRQELERWKERYIAIMADAFPPGKYENWNRCQMLFPHVELVLEYRPIDEGFLQQWTAVLNNAAWYARERANYDEAEQMNRRALDGRKKVLGKEHPDTLTSISNLALVLQDQGKYEQAEQMNRQALDAYEKVLGKEHPETMRSVNNLASVLQYQGKYEEAEQMNRRALNGYEKVLGKDHPFTLTSASGLASVLQDQGKYEQAKQMNRQALDAYEKVLGKEHPETMRSVNNLASVLQYQGKYEEAEQMNRRALNGYEKVLGLQHPETLASVNNLALVLQYQGKYNEAEQMNRRALSGHEKVLGKEHPDTLRCVNNLASMLQYQGKYEEAEQMNRQVLIGRGKVLGKEHPDTLTSVSNLASVLQYQGKYEEAEQMNRRALDGREQVLGKEHPSTLTSVSNLASVLQYQGKYEEAEQMNRRALDGREQVLGKEHPSTLTSMNNLASMLQYQGKYQQAEQMNRQALDAYEKVLGKEHPETMRSVNNLASVLQYQGKYEEAEQMNRRALNGYEKVLGKEHPETLASVNNLALVLQYQSKYEKAEQMNRRALDGRQKMLGKEHPDTLTSVHNLISVLQYQGKYEEAEQINRRELRTSDSITAMNETGGDGDSDDFSDLSEASSVQSLPSLVSDSSSISMRNKYASEATEHLATLLSEDPVLMPMYAAAIAKFGRERFHKNHDQLLKALFKDLRSETKNSVQLSAVRSLRNRDRRHEITLLIQTAYEPLNVHERQAMAKLRDQKPNRNQLLDNYLREKTSISQSGLLPILGNNLEHDSVSPLEQDDDLVDEGASSNSSDDSNGQHLDQGENETFSYLEPLENFITKGNAFAHFKKRFSYFLRPPLDLPEALESRDLRIIQRFLARNFVSVAASGYVWLYELDEAGYSMREIAELLFEDINDSPWIHFTPRVHSRRPIRTSFHVTGCVHQASFSTEPQSLLDSGRIPYYSPTFHTDMRRLVEELCGIGGVMPFSRDANTWYGSVTFEEQSSVSLITYAGGPAVARQSRNNLMARISNVISNFCTAAAAVQSSRLCCDSFTVLVRIQNHLELRRIEFRHALTMASNIEVALKENNTEAAIQQCVQGAEHILRELRVPIAETTPNVDLHYCALAAQFLCSAFLSYIQAHVGPIDPFFLDKPQRKLILLGNQHVPGDSAINAELVELTCLADMTQQLVFAFSSRRTSQESYLDSGTSRYDVLTNAEDCLDTWGPGYFIHNKLNPNKIHAIALGGGFIYLVDSKASRFHWAKGELSQSASQIAFEPCTTMRIGAAVSVNGNCCIDEAVYRKSSFCALEPLGTQEVFWEARERQAGLQGGQYFMGTYNQTWKKIPGTTLKQRTLQQPDDWRLVYFLDQNWGLQVSFCTSVARRVSLRELVTDLLPMFINPLKQDTWQELVNGHNIMEAFTQGNLFSWLRTLSPSLQLYVLTLVRTILEQLQHTGIDRRNTTLVIAWPQEGDTERGLRIPCRAETCWAHVIADAEDCATFAYVTSRCLETNHVKCQGSLRAWQNASKMLVTEMSPSGPEGQPVATTNATITTPAASVIRAATATAQWELEDQKIYYIKKFDSLLRVKVERPNSASSDVAHLVVATSKMPQGLRKRLLLRGGERRTYRIRERQATGDRAELVVIRADLMKAQRG